MGNKVTTVRTHRTFVMTLVLTIITTVLWTCSPLGQKVYAQQNTTPTITDDLSHNVERHIVTATEHLVRALQDANIDQETVRLYVVDRDHYLLRNRSHGQVAWAGGVTNRSYEYIIVVNADHLMFRHSSYMMRQVIRHEVAHIMAWIDDGHEIDEHGIEFVRACRQLLSGSAKRTECVKSR